MITIDAIGLACPQPVILAKRALKDTPEEVLVIVDNEVACQNLSRLGESQGREVQVNPLEDGLYQVLFLGAKKRPDTNHVSGNEEDMQRRSETENLKDRASGQSASRKPYVVVLSGEEMGAGDASFGRKLMEGFVYALCEQDQLPSYVLCYNKGVVLTTENAKTVADLQKLASQGVEVLSCGLCLDFYHLKEQLKVGQVTNMYRICELMTTYPTVRP